MLEKQINENQATVSVSKKLLFILQKRTISKLPATQSNHSHTHEYTNKKHGQINYLKRQIPYQQGITKEKAEFKAL